jgi:GTP cyclohydrolase II
MALGAGRGHISDKTPVTRGAARAVTKLAQAALPTRFGKFQIAAYQVAGDAAETVALIYGDPGSMRAPLVRLHSECLTGESLASLRCDCGGQLEAALERIARSGSGVLLYLRQEGRGIGIVNKIRAYALQDKGLDTVDANLALGLPADGREYAAAAAVLRFLGVSRVRLLTNNPAKSQGLERHGIAVVERVPVQAHAHTGNLRYLVTKVERMGHLLDVVAPAAAQATGADEAAG